MDRAYHRSIQKILVVDTFQARLNQPIECDVKIRYWDILPPNIPNTNGVGLAIQIQLNIKGNSRKRAALRCTSLCRTDLEVQRSKSCSMKFFFGSTGLR